MEAEQSGSQQHALSHPPLVKSHVQELNATYSHLNIDICLPPSADTIVELFFSLYICAHVINGVISYLRSCIVTGTNGRC